MRKVPFFPIAQKAYIIKKFIFLVMLCISPALYSFADEKLTYESEVVKVDNLVSITPKESSVVRKITPESEVKVKVVQSTVKQLIDKHFDGEDAKVAYAIIKAESGKNIRATGYNCYYKDGIVHSERVQGARSTFCKKGHEQYAWSVDCSYIQRNFPGKKECPEYTFDLEWNIKEMKKLHQERGWKPWVTYTSGKYLAYME